MKCQKETMRLYAVTDRTWVGRQTLTEQVAAAIRGGVTCVQLREKALADTEFLAEAMEIKALCHAHRIPFLIDDNVEVALRCGADGIHVGQCDMAAAEVRKRIGPNMILGVSAQTREQALAAEAAGADYLGVGAVFSTSTKPDAVDVPHDELKQICRAVQIPVVAIGGINRQNILQLSGTGVDGVAIISAIFGAADIEQACKTLLSLSEEMVSK